ncbi:MAG: hypothetical protein M0R48_03860 [Candidatus Omnitrophica bacterium]|jgi:hypothetical protein|nr:hypothetical protein [Candidatus Omnitrophota bacterium]
MFIKKAQATLESSVAYMAAVAILGAAMGIWAWGNAHIPVRQVTYTATRVTAGASSRSVDASGASGGNKSATWPRYVAAPCF